MGPKQMVGRHIMPHILTLVQQYADCLVVMDHGNILYQGSVDNFIKNTSSHVECLQQKIYSENETQFTSPLHSIVNEVRADVPQDDRSISASSVEGDCGRRPLITSDTCFVAGGDMEPSRSLFEALCQFINFDDQRPQENINQRARRRGHNFNRKRRRQ